MKTASDPRHRHRIALVQALYGYSFTGAVTDTIAPIVARIGDIDEKIASVATARNITDTNKIDLAILRLGVFELMEAKVAPNITIDEAIEIAKEYGSDNSSKFVNAVLSALAKTV